MTTCILLSARRQHEEGERESEGEVAREENEGRGRRASAAGRRGDPSSIRPLRALLQKPLSGLAVTAICASVNQPARCNCTQCTQIVVERFERKSACGEESKSSTDCRDIRVSNHGITIRQHQDRGKSKMKPPNSNPKPKRIHLGHDVGSHHRRHARKNPK